MKTLTGKTALITGAAGGIGTALAHALHDAGCQLVLTDIAPEGLPDLPGALHRALDVADAAAWSALAGELDTLDLLVHNAGVTVHGPYAEMTPEDVDWLLGINLRGTLYGTTAMLPLLRQSGDAHIVTIASMSALFGTPLQATYCASKYALRGFAGGLRIELAADGIGVTAVLPGTIKTSFLANARTHDAAESAWMAEQMLRVGTAPETVARAVLKGVLRNRAEVLVGLDAHAMGAVQRLAPATFHRLLGWAMRLYTARR